MKAEEKKLAAKLAAVREGLAQAEMEVHGTAELLAEMSDEDEAAL